MWFVDLFGGEVFDGDGDYLSAGFADGAGGGVSGGDSFFTFVIVSVGHAVADDDEQSGGVWGSRFFEELGGREECLVIVVFVHIVSVVQQSVEIWLVVSVESSDEAVLVVVSGGGV